jgi:hypothetical protein
MTRKLIVTKKAPSADSWQVYGDEDRRRVPGEPFRELGAVVGSVKTLDQLKMLARPLGVGIRELDGEGLDEMWDS